MAKQQRTAQQEATETIDPSLLEKVLATSEAQRYIDQTVAKRVAVDAAATVRYVPIGGNEEIEVSLERVNRQIPSTKAGRRPPRLVLEEYIQTCMQYRLNPYAKDIYLIGYDDSNNNTANWSVILSYHSLIKRAACFPEYDGFEAGIVVEEDGEIKEVTGTASTLTQKMIGGWCKVYRKDQSRPTYVTVDLEERKKDKGEWKNQRKWMMQKCAITAGFRFAFPNDNPPTVPTDVEFDMDDLIEETLKRSANANTTSPTTQPPASTADALKRTTTAQDTIGKFKGELTMELRRASTPEDVQRLRDSFTARAGGEVDKLEFAQQACDRKLMDIAKNAPAPAEETPAVSDELHGDAWEGEEDLAAIEEQIARES